MVSGGHGCGECRDKALARVAWMSLLAMHAVPFGVAYVAACARDGNADA